MMKSNSSIEDKIKQLEDQIEWFDGDDFKIELAIEKYDQAKKLSQDITQDIEAMKNEVTIINEQ